jgi:hypothetical protein
MCLGEFGDHSMVTVVLVETDEVAKTTIKILTSSALRKRLFHLFFILFLDVDTYDTNSSIPLRQPRFTKIS